MKTMTSKNYHLIHKFKHKIRKPHKRIVLLTALVVVNYTDYIVKPVEFKK